MPRVLAEVQGKALMAMLQQPGDALALLVDEVEKHGFDGLVSMAAGFYVVGENWGSAVGSSGGGVLLVDEVEKHGFDGLVHTAACKYSCLITAGV